MTTTASGHDQRLRPHRRHVLAGLAAMAAAPLAGPAEARRAPPGETAWRGLKETLSGPLLRPGDAGFALVTRPNNLRYAAILPTAVARCRTVEDVRAAILWARETGIPLAARSGGHSYAGFSQTTGLMIDMSLMHAIELDRSAGRAVLQGGARNAHVYAALKSIGATITHGRCLGVGAAAFLLGGGIGFNMRAFGLGADQVLETEMVTADGRIVTASERDHADLFWASRGIGGGNLGIHTRFVIQAQEARPMTAFSIAWKQDHEAVAGALLAALAAGPDNVGAKVTIATDPPHRGSASGLTVSLLGQVRGDRAALADLLAPAYRIARPAAETIRPLPYWDAQAMLSEDGGPGRYQEKSRFVTRAEAEALLPEAMARLARFPGGADGAQAKFFLTGGRINRVAPGATAFVHRASDWLFSLEIGWSGTDTAEAIEAALAWLDTSYDDMTRDVSGGAYQNFPDPSLRDAAAAYHGANLPRLMEVKRRYDPDNLFRFGQSVRPAGA